MFSLFFADCFPNVDGQQHGEDDGLDQAEQQAQHLHEQRQHEREEVAKLVRGGEISQRGGAAQLEVSVSTFRRWLEADRLAEEKCA